MTKATNILALLVAALTLAGCAWVKSDYDDCPTGVWLQMTYTRNLLDVDAAPQQVADVAVLVFDCDGNYVRRIEADRATLAQNDWRIELGGLPAGHYDLIVWGGLADSRFMASSASQMADFRVSLANPERVQDTEFADLFYGRMDSVEVADKYAIYNVGLTKDTNVLACQVASLSGNVEPDRYDISLTATNGVLNADNETAVGSTVTYAPFAQRNDTIDDAESGPLPAVTYGLKTMRLTEGDDSRLVLTDKADGTVLLSLPLTKYLAQTASLYTQGGRPLTAAEYLDRQDFHTIVFFLSESGSQVVQCKINNWVIRMNGSINL